MNDSHTEAKGSLERQGEYRRKLEDHVQFLVRKGWSEAKARELAIKSAAEWERLQLRLLGRRAINPETPWAEYYPD